MPQDERPVLVVGGTGFLGRHVLQVFLDRGQRVRCLARRPERSPDLPAAVEVVQGDMLDPAAVARAAGGVRAVIFCVHTLSRQPAAGDGLDFMAVEEAGLRAVVAACRAQQVERVLYVTSLGVAADAASTWLRGRARTEQLLLDSGLAATVVRPGMIVGRGGDGFGLVERAARRPVGFLVSSRTQRFRTISVTDLARDLVDLLDEPRSIGRALDVGSDDVLTMDQLVARVAAHLGRRPPVLVHVPRGLLVRAAPLVERLARLPRGAVSGFVGEGSDVDLAGDVTEARALTPPPLTFDQTLVAVLGPPVPPHRGVPR